MRIITAVALMFLAAAAHSEPIGFSEKMKSTIEQPEACAAITMTCGQTRTNPITNTGCTDSNGTYFNAYVIQGAARKPFRFEISSPTIRPDVLFGDSAANLAGSARGEPARTEALLAGSFPYSDSFYLFVNDIGPYTTGALTVTYLCTTSIQVPSGETLVLQDGRFRVTLIAQDQRTGNSAPGIQIPQNDQFGYFSIPGLTGDASNPEVFVKILNGVPVNGYFWVFYGGLTDLRLLITVSDHITGRSRTYQKLPGDACGGFDVSTFN